MTAPRFLLTTVAALTAAITLTAFGLVAWSGFPPGARAGYEFCECAPVGAVIRQPANTVSNLGFVVVGLLVALRADLDRGGATPRRNPMTTRALFPGLFALFAVLLGPSSMALHAAETDWGGALDVYSMYLVAGYALLYSVSRVRALSDRAFVCALVVLDLALLAAMWVPMRLVVFGALVAAVTLLEVVAPSLRPDLRRDRRWLYAGIGALALAFSVWIPSLTDGPLCDPSSLLQGHALWHLMCAVAVGALFLYYRSEAATPAHPAAPTPARPVAAEVA